MHWWDYALMILILGGAVWLIARSLFKEGQITCPDCTAEGCSVKKLKIDPKIKNTIQPHKIHH